MVLHRACRAGGPLAYCFLNLSLALLEAPPDLRSFIYALANDQLREYPKDVLEKKQHDDLVDQVRRLEQDMRVQTITTEQEMELLEFADRVWQGLNNFTFEEKRYTLETLDTRVDMLTPQRARISG